MHLKKNSSGDAGRERQNFEAFSTQDHLLANIPFGNQDASLAARLLPRAKTANFMSALWQEK